ncbi:Rab-like protein 2A [Blattella germanica]|nr:Rab-like protein 2A [Blattella germanica]
MAGGEDVEIDYDDKNRKGDFAVKVICLGDSAVGKSKLVERFLLDGYKPQQLSTYALTLFRYPTKVDDESVVVASDGTNVVKMIMTLGSPISRFDPNGLSRLGLYQVQSVTSENQWS